MLRQNLIAIVVAAIALPATAHELIVVPEDVNVAEGESLSFEVHATHVFAAPEEMESPDSVTAALVVPGGETREAQLAPADLYLSGTVEAADGPAWLVAHRLGQIWSQTPDGWKPGGRDVNPDARTAAKYEKFSKTLLNAGGAGYDEPLGHLLEIVPLSDPGELSAGDALLVQVIHDGKPVPAQLAATYAGFSERSGTWAYVTETSCAP